jgi:hypothetical protein
MRKAPLGGDATGKNPHRDRAKMGPNLACSPMELWHPLGGGSVEGANSHDSKLLVGTLEGLVVARPVPGEQNRMGTTAPSSTCAWRRPTTPM